MPVFQLEPLEDFFAAAAAKGCMDWWNGYSSMPSSTPNPFWPAEAD